ncbi:ribonuclease III [Pannonibacter sp.]|uniref:ribonuclease III n=1 Tax=Pannonibacter sp. TaxID=1906786 RepID=UPI0039288210
MSTRLTTTDPLSRVEDRISHRFTDRSLLEQALTHASALNNPQTGGSYQRLEFLGDRVLGLAVATMLHRNFPRADEGELARRLNHMVKRETCAEIAQDLKLGDAMRISQSEAQTGGRQKTALLADICEAVIAAIYLDAGMATAEDFVRRQWEPRMLTFSGPLRDAKTTLQEWAQARSLPAPTYDVVDRSGPDHAPVFIVAVHVERHAPAEGSGSSKRIAEQAAAEAMLRREGVWSE